MKNKADGGNFMGLFWSRYSAVFYTSALAVILLVAGLRWHSLLYGSFLFSIAAAIGFYDIFQK